MAVSRRVSRILAVAIVALLLPAAKGADAPPAPAPEEFIVTAKALADLRLKIERAENEAYARFNEINSDDSHDIHCFERQPTGSHIPRRWCVSNAWRAADEAIAQSYLRGLQSASTPGPAGGVGSMGDNGGAPGGSYGSIPGKYRANQLRTEQFIMRELGQLAHKDPALHDAMLRVGQARLALETVTGSKAEWTLYRDVAADDEGLPFGAKRLVEVRVGDAAWNHPLTSRTFTIGSVTGDIRGLRLRCDSYDRNLRYQPDAEWTVPAAWNDCTLLVRAKRGTTFALYEF